MLYKFCAAKQCKDGSAPSGGLIQGPAGKFYGTTELGGFQGCGGGSGGHRTCGTVFELDSTGQETVLYRFCAQRSGACPDGFFPVGGLIQDATGNLYERIVSLVEKELIQQVLKSCQGVQTKAAVRLSTVRSATIASR